MVLDVEQLAKVFDTAVADYNAKLHKLVPLSHISGGLLGIECIKPPL